MVGYDIQIKIPIYIPMYKLLADCIHIDLKTKMNHREQGGA